jgi:hypothetical protein
MVRGARHPLEVGEVWSGKKAGWLSAKEVKMLDARGGAGGSSNIPRLGQGTSSHRLEKRQRVSRGLDDEDGTGPESQAA